MYWVDKFVKQIIKSGKYRPYWVDDMKTPSGRIHVGSLRGVVIHDLIYKVLKEQNQKAIYTYCINDMDPMDGFPPYLDKNKFYKYMGWPLCKIPSPVKGFKSFSEYFAKEFIDVFNKIGCQPKIIWTADLYKEGKFDGIIKTCLDKTKEIRKIFTEHYQSFKNKNYFPYQPICPNCGKIATTKIDKWDGIYIYFHCQKNAVDYTEGCGFKGKIKPEKQNGKMPWKIEWAAHWKVLGVTIEWAGKDHMTQGGAHEVSSKICELILNYPTPHAELYEHMLIGGRKMSSSKGRGASAAEIAEILPPELLRFLMVKTHYRKTIDFDPNGNTIPDLFDEYDFYTQEFYSCKQNDFTRVRQLSQIGLISKTKPFLPRFRDVANYSQLSSVNIYEKFEENKGKKLTKEEKDILDKRIKYAKIWLASYAPKDLVYQMADKIPNEAKNLSMEQKKYLISLISLISHKDWQPDDLQQELYETAKKQKISTKKAFQAIYLVLIGKTYGPKAAWFLLEQDRGFVIKRLKDITELN